MTVFSGYINLSERATQHSMIYFSAITVSYYSYLPPLGCIVMTKEIVVHEHLIFGEAVSSSLEAFLRLFLPKQSENLVLKTTVAFKQPLLVLVVIPKERSYPRSISVLLSTDTCPSDSLKCFIEEKNNKIKTSQPF